MHSQAFGPCTQSFNIFVTQRGSRHYEKSLLLLPKAPGSQWLPVCLDRLPVPDSISMPASPGPSTGFFHLTRTSPRGLCTRTCQNFSPLMAEGSSGISMSAGDLMDIWVLLNIMDIWGCVLRWARFICLFKETLRAEWQGHKRSSRLTFRGAGKSFLLLVNPLCISSNNVWGLQYSNVLSDACPSLPFQTPL